MANEGAREKDEEGEKDKRYESKVDGSGEERGHGKVSCSAPVKLLLAIVCPSPTSADALRPPVRPHRTEVRRDKGRARHGA